MIKYVDLINDKRFHRACLEMSKEVSPVPTDKYFT